MGNQDVGGLPDSEQPGEEIERNEWPWNAGGMAAAYARLNRLRRARGLPPVVTGSRPSGNKPPEDQGSDSDTDSR